MLVQKTSPGRHRTLFIYQQYQGAEDPACGLAPSSDSDGALAFVLAAYWETVITLPDKGKIWLIREMSHQQIHATIYIKKPAFVKSLAACQGFPTRC